MTTIIKNLYRNWSHHFWVNISTLCVLTLSFLIIDSFLLVSKNLNQIFITWSEDIQMTVYLKEDIQEAQKQVVERFLKDQNSVETVTYLDKAQAMKAFETSIASYGPKFVKSIGIQEENPFPASLSVKIKSSARTPAQLELLAKSIETQEGVDEVSYGQDWVQNYSSLYQGLRLVFVIICLVLLLACLFSVGNAIRASQAARKEEVEIYELLGATNATIRSPFIWEGVSLGFFSSLFALMISYGMFFVIATAVEKSLGSGQTVDGLRFFAWYVTLTFLLLGSSLGAIGSFICVTKINTGWAAASGSHRA